MNMLTRSGATMLGVAAVAVVLGGTATAATLYTSSQIKDGSVYSRDIANGTLTNHDVKDAALTATDYDGPVVGPTGSPGPSGPSGPAGVRGLVYTTGDTIRVDPGGYVSFLADAMCPDGTKALSGGASSTEPRSARFLVSAPLNDGKGWRTAILNDGSKDIFVATWVVCARV